MLVFQTEGDPPNDGKIILAAMGCTRNSSAALRKTVRVKRTPNVAVIVARAGSREHCEGCEDGEDGEDCEDLPSAAPLSGFNTLLPWRSGLASALLEPR